MSDTPKRKYKKRVVRSPLQIRATYLLRRGFDVPPSKEADYRTMRVSGIKMAEIKEILGLE